MANEQNLKKFGSEREPSEAGRKGGKASGAARRRKRDMKNAAKLLLNMPVTGENTIKNLETLGFEEEDMTNQMALMVRVFQKAMQTGDVRAAEFLRDTAGYNPETNLKERQFKYEKDKANGMNQEIEDTSDVDDLIYGGKEEKTIPFKFGQKHMDYIYACQFNTYNILEGAVRSGKTIDNVYAFAHELKTCPDKIHLATGSTMANAKLNIGDANGFGLEYIFRGQCRWSKYKDNDCLRIKGPSTGYKEKIVIFAGGKSSDSYKKIRGNSYGMWIATEINLHHDNTIKEAFNRQLAAKRRKIFWDLNPEHPKAPIYANYLDVYEAKAKKGELLGGYNYQHFNIFENVNITKERLREIVSQYDQNSIWYIRDIEGKRSIAEGLIYVKLATSIAASDNKYLMSVEAVKKLEKENQLLDINIGVDFGGNGSGHAFVASTATRGYEKLIALASEWHDADGTDPDDLARMFVEFVKKIKATYGRVTHVYCDSAEQVLKQGLRSALIKNQMGDIKVDNSRKEQITNRIFTLTTLTAQDRFYYTEDCESLQEALSMAVWNPKNTELERLDDGTSDIDSLDAFEYSYEHDWKKFIKAKAG